MLNIAKKVIDINIRSSKFILFNALFPIFLIVLIGYMMSDEFSQSINIDTVNISYYNEGSEHSNLILKEVLENSKEMDIKLEKIDSIEKGKQSARLNESVFVHFDNDNIDVYANNKAPLDKAIVSSIFEGVNNKVNMMKVIYSEDNQAIIDSSQNLYKDIIEIDKIPQDKAPNSFDYYGIVEITMIAMYVGAYPIYSMRNERRYNLNSRIKLSSINNTKYYLGSFIGFCGLAIITTLPGYLFATVVLKINVGSSALQPYLLILSLSFMFIALGMVIECVCKDTDKAANFIQSIVFPVFSFLGGCYMNMSDNVGGLFQVATHISPIRWTNRSIFKLIYEGSNNMYICTLVVNILVTILIVGLVLKITKKEEARA